MFLRVVEAGGVGGGVGLGRETFLVGGGVRETSKNKGVPRVNGRMFDVGKRLRN